MSFEKSYRTDSGAPVQAGAPFFPRWSAPGGYRQVLRVSLPLVASLASSTVMQFTDRMFLSRYSMEAIAAAVPASFANMLFLLAAMGISGYAGVFIAQFVGAGQPQRVGAVLWQALRIAIVAGIVLMLLCIPAPWLFGLAGHSHGVLLLELEYFNVLMIGSVFALVSNALGCFYSGRGFTRPLMLANIAGAIINIPLDYALIYGKLGLPELGIFGAGLATALGWVFMTVLLGLMVFTRKNNRRFHVWKGRALDSELIRRMLRFGMPSGVNVFLEMMAATLFVFAVGRLGDIELAASNVVFSINAVAFLPMLGFNLGASILVGQAMGAKNPQGARFVAINTMHVGMIWMGIMIAIFLLFPGQLIDMFAVGGDPATHALVRQTGTVLMYFLALYCAMDAVSLVYGGALKGAGDTWFLLWVMLSSCVLFMLIPVIYMFWSGTATLVALWGCFSVYIGVVGLIMIVRFFRGSWMRIKVLGKMGE